MSIECREHAYVSTGGDVDSDIDTNGDTSAGAC